MQLVDGSTSSPIAPDSPLYKKDQMLLSWINATLSDSMLPYIVGVTPAQRAWNLLKQRYASTTLSHDMALKRKLNQLKKGSQPMNDYIKQIKMLSDQLVVCGATVSDDDLILITLYGLPLTYHQFCSLIRIHARSTILFLKELHTLLICEEIAVTEDSPPKQSSALIASRPSRQPAGRGFSHLGRTSSSGDTILDAQIMACCRHHTHLHLQFTLLPHTSLLLQQPHDQSVRFVKSQVILPSTAFIRWIMPIKESIL
ncbi:hypothetical protein NE237_006975 [Protea cynaroides]|uniref:Retrovirus-related Pol polyprotein from transposon TNT 1-94 n=1 Tax=Protea cynaroides TaxID=273540 RepID=A0A9Q0KP38_9MAGN|nr:hypothetical protein NE237_006975 [Protea cynaroides]